MEIVDLAKQAIASEGPDTALPSDPWRYRRRKTFALWDCRVQISVPAVTASYAYEHISVEGMQTAVRIFKNIATHPIRK